VFRKVARHHPVQPPSALFKMIPRLGARSSPQLCSIALETPRPPPLYKRAFNYSLVFCSAHGPFPTWIPTRSASFISPKLSLCTPPPGIGFKAPKLSPFVRASTQLLLTHHVLFFPPARGSAFDAVVVPEPVSPPSCCAPASCVTQGLFFPWLYCPPLVGSLPTNLPFRQSQGDDPSICSTASSSAETRQLFCFPLCFVGAFVAYLHVLSPAL